MTEGLRDYLVVTGAYWAFTLSDGALRMLVLLHFHVLGYSPMALAMLFLLYEVFGVLTNLFGGYLASRVGLETTLFSGLVLQVAALLMLSALSPEWAPGWQVGYALVAQGLSGIAKDLTKLSAKSAIKLLVPAGEHGKLFTWVALLTGSKNTLKGIGFFVGSVLLALLGFRHALWAMAGAIGLAVVIAALLLPRGMGRARAKVKLSQIFSKSRSINLLSAARLMLFGARDIWFVVALPVFLAEVVGWSFVEIGTFMALWIVGYGAVQAVAPRLLGGVVGRRMAALLCAALAVVPAAIAIALELGGPAATAVVGGLALFGVVFAINSAVHSYLILAYADADSVTLDVGFYYTANALGRLVGTLGSGLLYQTGGLVLCLVASTAMLVVASLVAAALPDPQATTAR